MAIITEKATDWRDLPHGFLPSTSAQQKQNICDCGRVHDDVLHETASRYPERAANRTPLMTEKGS